MRWDRKGPILLEDTRDQETEGGWIPWVWCWPGIVDESAQLLWLLQMLLRQQHLALPPLY